MASNCNIFTHFFNPWNQDFGPQLNEAGVPFFTGFAPFFTVPVSQKEAELASGATQYHH